MQAPDSSPDTIREDLAVNYLPNTSSPATAAAVVVVANSSRVLLLQLSIRWTHMRSCKR